MSRLLLALCALFLAPGGGPAPRPLPPFVFKDLRFLPRRLDELRRDRPMVLLLITGFDPETESCLKALDAVRAAAPEDIALLVLDLDPERTIPELSARAFERGLALRFGKDRAGASARALGLERPLRALAVLDGAGRVRYRGGASATLIKALPLFLAAIAKGAALPALPAVAWDKAPEVAAPPSSTAGYHRDIAPLIRRRCLPCHRPGGSAPFSLSGYGSLRRHAAMVAEVVREGRMPPWFAAGGPQEFKNHRGLTAAERVTLLGWLAAGARRGAREPEASPALEDGPAFAADLSLETRRAIKVPADGFMPYQYVRLAHRFAADTWVQKIAIEGRQPEALHHANLFYLRPGQAFDSSQIIAGLVPGGGPLILEDGLALMIPKGALLCLQLHYQPSGRAVEDRIKVRLAFPKVRVERRFRAAIIEERAFVVPAGASRFRLRASRRFEEEVIVGGLFGHMHLRGRAFRFWARINGDRTKLLSVPSYSFDWQMAYVFSKPRRFPAGAAIELEAFYDNSAFNPFNPDPDRPVGYGLQTRSEMMLGVVYYIRARERLSLRVDASSGAALGP